MAEKVARVKEVMEGVEEEDHWEIEVGMRHIREVVAEICMVTREHMVGGEAVGLKMEPQVLAFHQIRYSTRMGSHTHRTQVPATEVEEEDMVRTVGTGRWSKILQLEEEEEV